MQDNTSVLVKLVCNDRLRTVGVKVVGSGPRGARAELAVRSVLLERALCGGEYEAQVRSVLAMVEVIRRLNLEGWPEGSGSDG